MDADALDDLVRRLTALVVKIDDRDTQMAAMLAHHEAMLGNHDAMFQEQSRIHAEVSATLARLTTLMTEVFRDRHNGPEG